MKNILLAICLLVICQSMQISVDSDELISFTEKQLRAIPWPFQQGPDKPYQATANSLYLNNNPTIGHSFEANISITFRQTICKYSLNYQIWLEDQLVGYFYGQPYSFCHNSGSTAKWPALIPMLSTYQPGVYKFRMFMNDQNKVTKALEIFYYANVS